MKLHLLQIASLIVSVFLAQPPAYACSFYKFTLHNKTFVGSNEDAWRTQPHIWFESKREGRMACAFTGSRAIGPKQFAAQSGMNEAGICFARLASWHPFLEDHADNKKPAIPDSDRFLMDVLRSCTTLDEVKHAFEKYNRSCYLEDIFVYVDRAGNYLQVEPYNITEGNKQWLVQANFCPSITPESERKQARYVDGKHYFGKGLDTSFAFCKEAFEEMHVCREKLGDGTLLSSLWNPVDGRISLFFYHDYEHVVHFDFEEMTAKDQQISVLSLFPVNPEFEALKSFVTPFNSDWIRAALALEGMFFLILAGGLTLAVVIRRKRTSIGFHLAVALLSIATFFYCLLLTTDQSYFYFTIPYTSSTSGFFTVLSWYPYVALPAYFMLLGVVFRRKLYQKWTRTGKLSLGFGAVALLPIFAGVFYWELF